MLKKYIFCVEAEVGATDGHSLPGGFAGAFLNLYVGADTLKEALVQVEFQLAQGLYALIFIRAAYVMESRAESCQHRREDFSDERQWSELLEGQTIHYGELHDEYSNEDIEY